MSLRKNPYPKRPSQLPLLTVTNAGQSFTFSSRCFLQLLQFSKPQQYCCVRGPPILHPYYVAHPLQISFLYLPNDESYTKPIPYILLVHYFSLHLRQREFMVVAPDVAVAVVYP